MREEIARLMSLQAIDRELRELERALTSVAGRVEQLRSEVEKQQTELDRLTGEEQESALARRQLEKELAEGEARIRNKRMRLNQVRNEKEMQALAHEVETQKEANQRFEADLLSLMEASDPRNARIAELTPAVEQLSTELTEAEKEIAAQVEDLKISIAKQRMERDLMAGNLERGLLQRYEMIFNRRNGLAVAEARGGTCQGCRMRLPPQLYNQIQRHDSIHFCPNCQRILYHEGEGERHG
ncbi:MAG TPA: C4-type zinc ribbon domain-containing protein [Candidatus Binataceae bacterium]|nr:C4-type zinc ribbon domain-containing protein [Candidatus Binataceae bacterium]